MHANTKETSERKRKNFAELDACKTETHTQTVSDIPPRRFHLESKRLVGAGSGPEAAPPGFAFVDEPMGLGAEGVPVGWGPHVGALGVWFGWDWLLGPRPHAGVRPDSRCPKARWKEPCLATRRLTRSCPHDGAR